MEETKTNEYLEKERLGRLIAKYAVPCIISLVIAALYNIVDQIFIANAEYLGSYGNAANTVVFPSTVIALSLAVLVGEGCCTFVSINLGAGERDRARRGVGNSIVCIIVAGVALMAVYLLLQEPIIYAFGGGVNEETFNFSKEYFFWITLGIPFYMFAQAMSSVIRSDGSPAFSMIMLCVGAVINIVLDYVFIYCLGMGMTGAAVATISGQIVSAIMAAVYIFKMKAVKPDLKCLIPDIRVIKRIFVLGLASFMSQISVAISMTATLKAAEKFGAADEVFGQEQYAHIPTAIIGIVIKLFQIIISIAAGLAAGCSPVAGYNYGAKRYDRVSGIMKRLLIIETAIGVAASLAFVLLPEQIIKIFGSENESAYYSEYGVWFIRAQLCLLPLACVNKGAIIFLQSIGRSAQSSVLSIVREIVFGTAFPVLLTALWGLYALPFFMPLADGLSFIAVAALLIVTARRLKHLTASGVGEESYKEGKS